MSSATKIQKSAGKHEEDYASKKKKVRPYPEDLEEGSNSKKVKTNSKTISKSKMSTQKKTEVTFSDRVEEIKDTEEKENRKEENNLTPLKTGSPSKQSLKSVKEHKKTPYSKIKDNSEDQEEIVLQAIQPNFNTEIIGSSRKSRGTTPLKQESEKKMRNSKSKCKSRSKSPLGKIKEEIVDSDKKSVGKMSEKKVSLDENLPEEKKEEAIEEPQPQEEEKNPSEN